jgi:Short C-terminal domain
VAPQDEVPIVLERQPVPVQEAPPSSSIPEQIEKLAYLRDSGAITEQEYEAKKRDLLNRM